MRFRFLYVIPSIVLIACLGDSSITGIDPPTGPGKHVLFVGNSLTYVNDLPGMVEALADSAGEVRLETRSVAFPDFSLEDHWNEGTAAASIKRGSWHMVVLQQGPSSVEENRQLLIQYAKLFDGVDRSMGTATGLYMVWPTADRQQDFQRSSDSYRLAAQAVNGTLFPVGDAWREAWKRDASLPLYAADGLHPSTIGSYLAALVIYQGLYGKSAQSLPRAIKLRSGSVIVIAEPAATTLKAAAAAVMP